MQFNITAVLPFQAVGASVRIFELFDKTPEVPNEGGMKLDNLQGGNSYYSFCPDYLANDS
jgi:hypothetical protein